MEKLKRLPRKIKKKLKKTFWAYPKDEKGYYYVAFPYKYKKDYEAMKAGIVQDMLLCRKDNRNPKLIEAEKSLNREIYVEDAILKTYIDEIFAEEFRFESYQLLLKAKKNHQARVAYFQFINAYNIHKNIEDYEIVCCATVDYARMLLKEFHRKQNKKRKRKNA